VQREVQWKKRGSDDTRKESRAWRRRRREQESWRPAYESVAHLMFVCSPRDRAKRGEDELVLPRGECSRYAGRPRVDDEDACDGRTAGPAGSGDV
jgi:hypothetical protein